MIDVQQMDDAPLPAGMGGWRTTWHWGVFGQDGELLGYGYASTERRARRKAKKWLRDGGTSDEGTGL